MTQPEPHAPHRFSLLPGNITRLFLLLMVLLLISLGVIVQNTINIWLKDRSYQIATVAQQLHKRIETYRYITWQIYDNVAVNNPAASELQETRLRPDIYYLEKPRHKIETLIYGPHDSNTLEISERISSYLDTLWGAEQIPWSVYYLNGQDNSLILLSTLPLKDRATSFKEPDMHSLLESRRTELLQQANTLDVRESFSALRFINWQNGYYLTMRTTFNQPGHLPTVVAFDLPLQDLVPPDMLLNQIQINSTSLPLLTNKLNNQSQEMGSIQVNFTGSHIDITSPVIPSQLSLSWQIPLTMLLSHTLQDSLFPLLLNLFLLMLVIFGYASQRYPAASPERIDNNSALHILRALNEEIIALLPIGLLVFDKDANRILFSNKIADHLLPHLDLANISALAEQHQGVIQVTINNELYEIRLFYSQVTPRTQIFILRDQDREILVNSKLQLAKKLYNKNQRARMRFMQHLTATLRAPLEQLTRQLSGLPAEYQPPLQEQLHSLVMLIEQIQLAHMLESSSWQGKTSLFSVQQLLDELLTAQLADFRRKGLTLLVDNSLPPGELRSGDQQALRTILSLLLSYSVTNTQFGRITLLISASTDEPQRLCFSLLDTGDGVSLEEKENVHFPFLNDTSSDNYGKASGLTYYLCQKLATKLGGGLTIHSRQGLGTRYDLTVVMPPQASEETAQERLLDGMTALVDIRADEVRELVSRWLTQRGAQCSKTDEKVTRQAYDMFFTDNPSNLTASGILLSDDVCGVQQYGAGQWRVNFNISNDMQEAVLQLIEKQLILQDEPDKLQNADKARQDVSDYYPLFVETVPTDVQKLYTEISVCDLASMAQTAHRLKGVFAMLGLLSGKQLCETLECHIRENDMPAIEKDTSDLDNYVNRLLSQGSLNE